MSTYDLLGLRAYWSVVGDGVDLPASLEMIGSSSAYSVQDGRVDVFLGEQVKFQVSIEAGPPPHDLAPVGTTFFPAGDILLDDSESGFVRTDVALEAPGQYHVFIVELDRAERSRAFRVTLSPVE